MRFSLCVFLFGALLLSSLLLPTTLSFTSPRGRHQTTTTTVRSDKTMCFSSSNDNEQEDFQVQTWNPLRLLVLRLGFTEPMATSPLNYGKYNGEFNCAYCGQTLFDSDAKYDSGSGWPSFWRSYKEGAISYKMEFDGRLECRCGRCQSHLGHVFLDGPLPKDVPPQLLALSPESDPRGKTTQYLPRFCINGAALTYKEQKSSNDENDK